MTSVRLWRIAATTTTTGLWLYITRHIYNDLHNEYHPQDDHGLIEHTLALSVAGIIATGMFLILAVFMAVFIAAIAWTAGEYDP